MQNDWFVALQRVVPQHALSRLVGVFGKCELKWVKNTFIRWFKNRYQVDMSQALQPNPYAYASFNAFFTRRLRPEARPIATGANDIVSPADGTVSQLGAIREGTLLQAKKFDYQVAELLGGDEQLASLYRNGTFLTIYLSPSDYHRVHMPLSGTLTKTIHVPGDLFSVNRTTVEGVPRLFSRNERLVCQFDTAVGPMAVIMVGAMIVASIETPFAGLITPLKSQIRTQFYGERPAPVQLAKGDELGRFLLGSTVIVLLPEQTARWREDLAALSKVNMGSSVGELLATAP